MQMRRNDRGLVHLADVGRRVATAASICLATLVCRPSSAQVDEPAALPPHADGHVVIKLRPGVSIAPRPAGEGWIIEGPASTDGEKRRTSTTTTPTTVDARAALEATLIAEGVAVIEPALRRQPRRADLARSIGLDRYYLAYLPVGGDPAATAAALSGHPALIEAAGLDGLGGPADAVPNDEHFPLQYALQNLGQAINGWSGVPGADIAATDAWMMSTGTSDVVIAVLDSGVNAHVELAGRMISGWNSILENEETSDSCASHGTHVAGIACANADNGTGIAGVNWAATIMPVRILNGCTGLESDLANGITWAVDHDADILNMSLQYGVGSSFLHDAVQYADAQGVVQIAASGNNGFSGGVAFPGRWPETITVAATNNRDQRAGFSNFGPEVDIAAPGDDVYSLSGTTGYTYRDGTSMAAPHVSGLAGLMLDIDPTLTAADIRSILETTAHDVHSAGYDEFTGWGRIDANAALTTVQDGVTLPGDVNADGAVDVDDLLAVLLAWGECPETGPCPADLDENGVVDVDDVVLVILNWT